jgi:hypothetical protein
MREPEVTAGRLLLNRADRTAMVQPGRRSAVTSAAFALRVPPPLERSGRRDFVTREHSPTPDHLPTTRDSSRPTDQRSAAVARTRIVPHWRCGESRATVGCNAIVGRLVQACAILRKERRCEMFPAVQLCRRRGATERDVRSHPSCASATERDGAGTNGAGGW